MQYSPLCWRSAWIDRPKGLQVWPDETSSCLDFFAEWSCKLFLTVGIILNEFQTSMQCCSLLVSRLQRHKCTNLCTRRR